MTKAAAARLALRLMAEYGLLEDGWGFAWNRRKRGMGRCYPHLGVPGRIELSAHFVERNPLEMVRDTVLHEIAHALCPPGECHGPLWVETCRRIGANPERVSHTADMPPGRWRATCRCCGFTHTLHRRPKRLDGHCCGRCGPGVGDLRWMESA